MFDSPLQKTIEPLIHTFNKLDPERREKIAKLSDYVQRRIAQGEPARLNFICTHNSRRSHIAQIWAWAAARYYGIEPVETYSGGTEVTAFNPRAVAALVRAGFKIAPTTATANPVYHVRIHDHDRPQSAFSKVYTDAPNPQTSYCAVLTCAQVDQACPVVSGASARVSLSYDDPKAADDTQIGRAHV